MLLSIFHLIGKSDRIYPYIACFAIVTKVGAKAQGLGARVRADFSDSQTSILSILPIIFSK